MKNNCPTGLKLQRLDNLKAWPSVSSLQPSSAARPLLSSALHAQDPCVSSHPFVKTPQSKYSGADCTVQFVSLRRAGRHRPGLACPSGKLTAAQRTLACDSRSFATATATGASLAAVAVRAFAARDLLYRWPEFLWLTEGSRHLAFGTSFFAHICFEY